jgi:hypothetical protein
MALDADTNFVLTGSFGLYVPYKAAFYGCVQNEDDGKAAKFQGMAEAELARAIKKDKRSRLPNRMTLSIRRDVYGAVEMPRPRGR